MLCTRPFLKGVQPLACGQCLNCRINKRRIWTARMMLELYQHRSACFVTLTYSPEHLPKDESVSKRHFQLFMKRLRYFCTGVNIRFFGVGEYGDKSGRAHYHVMLYGIGPDQEKEIKQAWTLGLVHIGSVSKESCQYIAGYVTKKMTKKDDPRLKGRAPEFSLMSRRPGIGASAADRIGETLTRSSGGALWVAQNGDVPHVARMENGFMPLGRYLVGRVRLAVGIEGVGCPPEKLKEYNAQMLAMRESVGNVAFKAASPFVDWQKADSVVAKYAAQCKLSRKIL